MRTVNPPLVDSVALFDSVSGRRSADAQIRLGAARPDVLHAYTAYEAPPPDVTALVPIGLAPATKQDLRTNYEAFVRTHREVRDELIAAMPWGNCPLCGDRTASTLDHFLPRATYAEFAVLPLNLVPACWECNTTKRDDVCDASGPLYLHMYLDQLDPTKQFLFARVTVSGGVPTIRYRVAPPNSIGQHLCARVRSHFNALQLASYYERKGLEEIGYHAQSVRDQLADGVAPDDIKDGLRRDAAHVASLQGVNHWRHVGLLAIADSDDFCSGACSAWIPA